MGFTGSADDNIFSTEPSAQDSFQALSGGNYWGCLGVGWIMGREGVSDKWEGARLWRG